MIKAYSQGGKKKGTDGGIDGLFWFGQKKKHKAIVSVKGGTFDVDGFGTVQRLQIVTIEDAIAQQEGAVDTRIRHADTYEAAPKEKKADGQTRMDL